jgi:hypothetical protein
MDYSNLQEGVAACGAVSNDATTKLIAGVSSDNQTSTMHDLRTRGAADVTSNRRPPSLPEMVSPPVVPTDHSVHRDFGHLFPQIRAVRDDRT